MNIKGAGFDVNLFYTLKSSSEAGAVQESPVKTGEVLPAQERRKTDSVEISAQYGEDSGTFAAELKKELAGSIVEQPGTDRLQHLQEEVSAGAYDTDASELAQLMLQ